MTRRERGQGAVGDAGLAGLTFGMVAYAVFGMHDAAIKWLAASLPLWQVLMVRSLTIVVGCVAVGRVALLDRARRTAWKRALLFRGAVTLAAWLCYYTASRSLQLAQLTALYFAAPVFVTLMAAPLLGEVVTRARWASVALGFVGVLVATDPWQLSIGVPELLVIVAATLWAYGIILMRQIARAEPSLVQMLYTNLFFLGATAIGTAVTFRVPTLADAVLMAGVGLLGGIGQFTLFEAARRAPASVLGTIEYSALLWAFGIGYLAWRDVPDLAVWSGAFLIVGAGVLLIVTERVVAQRGNAS